MSVLRSKDFAAGLTAAAIGAFVVWVASDYGFGTPRRMGPGFFPVGLGVILILVGAAIMISSLRDREALPSIPIRPFLILPATILLFAIMLRRIGYAPAGIITVIMAGMAERYASLGTLVTLAAFLVPATWFVFAVVLGIPIPFLAWNF